MVFSKTGVSPWCSCSKLPQHYFYVYLFIIKSQNIRVEASFLLLHISRVHLVQLPLISVVNQVRLHLLIVPQCWMTCCHLIDLFYIFYKKLKTNAAIVRFKKMVFFILVREERSWLTSLSDQSVTCGLLTDDRKLCSFFKIKWTNLLCLTKPVEEWITSFKNTEYCRRLWKRKNNKTIVVSEWWVWVNYGGLFITCFANGLVYVLVSCLHKQTNKQNTGLTSACNHRLCRKLKLDGQKPQS